MYYTARNQKEYDTLQFIVKPGDQVECIWPFVPADARIFGAAAFPHPPQFYKANNQLKPG